MTIHSTQLGWVNCGAGSTVLFTVPLGAVVIVRDWQIQNTGAVLATGELRIDSGPGPINVQSISLAAGAGTGPDRERWLVLEAGEALYFQSAGGTFRAMASGTLLTAL